MFSHPATHVSEHPDSQREKHFRMKDSALSAPESLSSQAILGRHHTEAGRGQVVNRVLNSPTHWQVFALSHGNSCKAEWTQSSQLSPRVRYHEKGAVYPCFEEGDAPHNRVPLVTVNSLGRVWPKDTSTTVTSQACPFL